MRELKDATKEHERREAQFQKQASSFAAQETKLASREAAIDAREAEAEGPPGGARERRSPSARPPSASRRRLRARQAKTSRTGSASCQKQLAALTARRRSLEERESEVSTKQERLRGDATAPRGRAFRPGQGDRGCASLA